MSLYPLAVDRSKKVSLTEQIRSGIVSAIDAGVLQPGARLPSWRDLAAQLGVARGTVRSAYERLQDSQLIVSAGATGTRVAERRSGVTTNAPHPAVEESLPEMYADFSSGPGIFQMGAPALDCIPSSLFARITAKAARNQLVARRGFPDPRGEGELRREIAAHLALSRSMECLPSQVIITSGFTGGLGLTLRALRLREGQSAWMEDPGYPITRHALGIAQLDVMPVPVDHDGIDVESGIRRAPNAAIAVVTAGQQAPLGATLSLSRRLQLLDWANDTGAWIIEDDYLGELQLRGRAAPALASLDRAGRVIHIGSFSKTLSPTLRLGFVVVPPALVVPFGNAATCLAPAPGPAVQLATARFMREGHYLRHLRRMKRIYAQRRDSLIASFEPRGLPVRVAGLAMLLDLPDGASDTRIAREAPAFGLNPSPLSQWYGNSSDARSGLLLGVTTVPDDNLDACCDRLHRLIETFS